MQLALDFTAPAYPVSDPAHPAYDRLNDGPLTAHELACLTSHGYVLIEADAAGALFRLDGRDVSGSLDFWRSEIDVLYLLARNASEVR
jgi:hypothetical protein